MGQRTDYDKLILDITTNGALNPDEALRQAAEILVDRLTMFTDPDRTRTPEEAIFEGPGQAPAGGGMDEFLIEDLELGVRSYNCLKRVGLQTVGDGFRERTPSLATFDLHADYTLNLSGGKQRVVLMADVFNLLDNQDPLNYDNFTEITFGDANEDYGLPKAGGGLVTPGYNTPRQVRVGARFEW